MMSDDAGHAPGVNGHSIRIRGARVHNLRNVDVDVPRDKLVVFTGVSGSGKSSLAFDTLYAEGQRRYLEGLSVYARQFLDQLERPDVDAIEGLPPTVAIDQKAGAANPRSTVGTVTEVHDYLRLLYARAGVPHCPACGTAIQPQTPGRVVESVLALPEGTKLLLLAPLVRGRKGQHSEAFETIRRAGLLRARVDGQVVEIAEPPKLAKTKVHDIEAVVDRLVVREGVRARLAESVDRALELGEGTIILSVQEGDAWNDRIHSTRHACPNCGAGFEPPEPRSFSFNSPHGACPACEGLGARQEFSAASLVPDRSRTLDAAIGPALDALPPARAEELRGALAGFVRRRKVDRGVPLARWPKGVVDALIAGDEEFPGLAPVLTTAHAEAKTDSRRTALETFREATPCPACGGSRLRPEARAVRLHGRGIHEVSALPVVEAAEWFRSLHFEPPLDAVGPPLVGEIVRRLEYLRRVGLDYLTLDRATDTLSGGELQRVRLAAQIGSGLVGVAFVLDEPTAGLHPRDTDRLLATLRDLRDASNSVLVVEHDEETIRAADWVIDLGPGAGPDGGCVVAEGPPGSLDPGVSVTARFLVDAQRQTPHPLPADGERGPNSPLPVRGERSAAQRPGEGSSSRPAAPRATRLPATTHQPGLFPDDSWLTILGATEHNLKGDPVRIPVGSLTGVSGVSGSGKSTLVLDVLARAAQRAIHGSGPAPGRFEKIEGLDRFERVITIDQAPIGRTPRSTPATYTGVFDEIRRVFAQTREAKARGYGPSRFSFNAKEGRCERCGGQGMRRIEMQFLPDLFVPCEVCGGRRYNRPTLEVKFKGRSISDVLAMRVDEAVEIFDAIPKVHRGLLALHDAGLGYVTLGQSSTTLSGGEAQRVKLAAELGRPALGQTLYILDEPTTGLHAADVANLLVVLRRLAGAGNTLVVIEHNLAVLRAADWIIDLGPEGGAAGGHVVVMGPPEAIAAALGSFTGAYLRRDLIASGPTPG